MAELCGGELKVPTYYSGLSAVTERYVLPLPGTGAQALAHAIHILVFISVPCLASFFRKIVIMGYIYVALHRFPNYTVHKC